MPKHAGDDPVMVGYASSRNITFRSRQPEPLGITWADWRDMDERGRSEALSEYANRIVDVWVEEDE